MLMASGFGAFTYALNKGHNAIERETVTLF